MQKDCIPKEVNRGDQSVMSGSRADPGELIEQNDLSTGEEGYESITRRAGICLEGSVVYAWGPV